MSARPTSAVLLAGVALTLFTLWITRQAKSLEQDLDGASTKISLLHQAAPEFRLTALDGRAISLADYHGKKRLVLVFWAPWNTASHAMLTMMNMMGQQKQADASFEVLAISVDDDRAAAQKFVNDSKLPYPVVLDQNRAITDSYRVRVVPTALAIDLDGKVEFGAAGQRAANGLMERLGLATNTIRFGRGPNGGRGN